jgi:hypothetical protein
MAVALEAMLCALHEHKYTLVKAIVKITYGVTACSKIHFISQSFATNRK